MSSGHVMVQVPLPPVEATLVLAETELFKVFWSSVAPLGGFATDEIFAVLVITVPIAVPALTLYVATKVATAPEGKLAIEQVDVPPPPDSGLLQVNAGPDVC